MVYIIAYIKLFYNTLIAYAWLGVRDSGLSFTTSLIEGFAWLRDLKLKSL